jgi:hypothetical protein
VERGERQYVAIERLRSGLDVCTEVNLLPQWWMFRLAINIVDDLWSSSFHARLPLLPNNADSARWNELRSHFIALLFMRSRAEIDLWPSQLDAAQKAVDEDKDLARISHTIFARSIGSADDFSPGKRSRGVGASGDARRGWNFSGLLWQRKRGSRWALR